MSKIFNWFAVMFLGLATTLMGFELWMIVHHVTSDGSSPTALTDLSPVLITPDIDPTTLSVTLGEISIRSRTNFAVRLTNTSSRPVKIVGVPGICQKMGCIEAVNPPATILPNQIATLHFTYSAKAVGLLRLSTAVYFDTGGQAGFAVPITVTGSVVDPDRGS